MSLYIHQENQKLLWDSIHQYPLFQNFSHQNPQIKEQWFRNIIEKFYEHNRFKSLTIKEVQQLNRETILYMIEDLKQTSAPNVNYNAIDQSPMSYSSLPMENKDASRDAIMERKQNEIQSKFTLRQQEYSSMLQNGPSFEIDFTEKSQDDSPIENMENLMQNVMKQREYDLTETPKLQVIDLGNNEKKRVTFEENTKTSTDSLDMKDFIEKMNENIESLKQDILSLQSKSENNQNAHNIDNILSRMKKLSSHKDQEQVQETTNK